MTWKMTIATLSDQFFAASEKYHHSRKGLKVLEQELLRYTED
jgi:hypothetical protein|tara:strand:- start:654 stop:779 length:126 start_codon:yes stop_codon:yes gene_type:complete